MSFEPKVLKASFLVVALLISLQATQANAMTYSFHKLNEKEIIIDASGRIDNNELATMIRFISNYIPEGLNIRGITLNSRGGEINDAKDAFLRCWNEYGTEPWLDEVDVTTLNPAKLPGWMFT